MVLMSPIPLHLTPSKPSFYLFAFCCFCNIFRMLLKGVYYSNVFKHQAFDEKLRCVSAYSCNKNNAYVSGFQTSLVCGP